MLDEKGLKMARRTRKQIEIRSKCERAQLFKFKPAQFSPLSLQSMIRRLVHS